MLGRDHDRVDSKRFTRFVVLDGDLGFAIRAEERSLAIASPHPRQLMRQLVREADRHRHELGGFATGVTEHHALVAGALFIGVDAFAIHTERDIGTLGFDRDQHSAARRIEPHRRGRVSDLPNRASNDRGDVHVGVRGDLARDVHISRFHQCLARNPATWVTRNDGVEDGITHFVAHLVGMAFGHGFAGEKDLSHDFILIRRRLAVLRTSIGFSMPETQPEHLEHSRMDRQLDLVPFVGMTEPFGGLLRIDLTKNASSERAAWTARCARNAGLSGPADEAARQVIAAVAEGRDGALVRLIERFEGRQVRPNEIEVDAGRWEEATTRVPAQVRAALEAAALRILRFHRTQKVESSGLTFGAESLQSRVAPLRRVAVYAPGGTAAYPSSVLMAAIPAKVAGVREIFLFTPRAADVVLLAARIAGVDRVFEVGGAQAIAAAALGTETIPRVDKIVGPGNAYVTAAKRQVFGHCDIDGIAGPSEILVLADRSASAKVVAADLISQAEHDPLASAILVTDHPELSNAVDDELIAQLASLPRAEIAAASLRDHGAAVLVANRSQMIEAANDFAPEHLALVVEGAEGMAQAITAAGAIFVGGWTPEAAGDYTAGPSHVLPTAGAARFGSPLGVWDFVKYTSVVKLDEHALREQAEAITTLARAEGLEGHARAVEIRLGK